MPRVTILADGISKAGHLSDRHFLEVNGEPLIHRTIRQFSWTGVEVLTSIPDVIDRLPAGTEVVPGSDQSHMFFGADMIRKGLGRCNGSRNIIVFGDVYFTDEAVDIIRYAQTADWAVYGRSRANKITAPWAEYFAIEMRGFPPVRKGKKALETIANYYMAREFPRCTAWEWYYEMEGLHYGIADSKKVHTGPHWVEINDATDDIDVVEDILRIRRHA